MPICLRILFLLSASLLSVSLSAYLIVYLLSVCLSHLLHSNCLFIVRLLTACFIACLFHCVPFFKLYLLLFFSCFNCSFCSCFWPSSWCLFFVWYFLCVCSFCSCCISLKTINNFKEFCFKKKKYAAKRTCLKKKERNSILVNKKSIKEMKNGRPAGTEWIKVWEKLFY